LGDLREHLREYGAVTEVFMQDLSQLPVRDAKTPAANSRHASDGAVVERVMSTATFEGAAEENI